MTKPIVNEENTHALHTAMHEQLKQSCTNTPVVLTATVMDLSAYQHVQITEVPGLTEERYVQALFTLIRAGIVRLDQHYNIDALATLSDPRNLSGNTPESVQ